MMGESLMTVLRWIVLLLALAPSVVAPAASAQDIAATPERDLPEPLAAIRRDFQVGGMTLVGPASLVSLVLLFETPEEAAAELPKSIEFYRDWAADLGDGELREASTPKLGDARKAYAGTTAVEDQKVQVGIFGWQEADRIYVLMAFGLSGDMLTPLFDLGSTIAGRPLPATEVIPATEQGEMAHGGIYELQPTLEDMPPGWVFMGDQELTVGGDSATPAP
jgi:hypothetical protein